MANLSTKYLGLKLQSPIIVSSCGLTNNVDNLKIAENNGAGAVVLKSLFEEQINFQASQTTNPHDYPEASDYIDFYTKSNSLNVYLKLIRDAKSQISIPVIPSINCVSTEDWISFAKNIENEGADALEINMFFLPIDKNVSSHDSELVYFDLIEKLTSQVSIPISLKLGQRFTNILHLIDNFYKRGISGVVLFNRFYEPDIDINTLNITPASVFSNNSDQRYVLRWIAMVDAFISNIEIAATTGVHSGRDAIKYILAGADAVQVASTLYNNGLEFLSEMNNTIALWMDEKGFNNLNAFKSKLNYSNIETPNKYERAQFMKYFSSYE